MEQCKLEATPMNTNENLTTKDETGMADGQEYRSLVGKLVYLTHSHPNISFAVGVISQFMHCLTKHHFGIAKRILRYIAGTKELDIWYHKGENLVLKAYTDSDWARLLDDRKNTTENCFMLGSTVIGWSSKKQPTIAISTAGAAQTTA
ncbi:uncharacterized mitochondrial protein AtMg00810-like [Andrographis paniculata]|uniref:uncharacterized mitochondrial protein AtMg00810-like n=1 Tax=Andrographis paniculata TaxID=175694 RepID=UPI0021E89351|nr:uncharacterized mitochondrial protein AtMg00810-like [Andrographis paniculata]